MTARRLLVWMTIASIALLAGCAAKAPLYNYAAFQQAKVATLLVMPPVNDSPDIKATPAVWASATRPLAEAGYYVLPVTLVDETFKQNGVNTANDAADIPYPKLHEFFGADAAVYLKVKKYGTSYAVLTSETRVEVEARLIDLRSGVLLWEGKAMASSSEQQQTGGGLVGMLVMAAVRQIASNLSDSAFIYAAVADQRLLGAPSYNGVLWGPRSPLSGQPPAVR